MNLSNLSGSNLIAFASSLAILISQDLTTDEIGLLATFFSALGDNLAILAINSTNKITSVNSCLFFIVAIKPSAQVGNLYPQNLLNFSFTETELTS